LLIPKAHKDKFDHIMTRVKEVGNWDGYPIDNRGVFRQDFLQYANTLISGLNKKSDDGKTLAGYQHIHMFVLYCLTDARVEKVDILNKARLANIAFDITHKGMRRGKGARHSSAAAFLYCIKNVSHAETYRGTGWCLGKTHTVSVYLPDGRNEIVDQYMTKFHRVTCVPFQSNVLLACKDPITVLSPAIVAVGAPSVIVQDVVEVVTDMVVNKATSSLRKLVVGNTKIQIAYSIVVQHLRRNNRIICDGYIFQKIRGSRMSYGYYSPNSRMVRINLAGYIAEICVEPEYADVAETLAKYMKTITTAAEIGSTKGGLPIMDFTAVWIEYKDFFLHIPSNSIVLSQSESICYMYHPGIALSMLMNAENRNLERFVEGGKWFTNIRANINDTRKPHICTGVNGQLSHFPEVLSTRGRIPGCEAGEFGHGSCCVHAAMFANGNLDDFMKCFKSMTYYPARYDFKVPILYGEPGSGKSSSFVPLKRLYPASMVGTFDDSNSFTMGKMLMSKMIIVDDTQESKFFGLLETCKQIHGGSRATRSINAKYKQVVNVDAKPVSMIVTCNSDPVACLDSSSAEHAKGIARRITAFHYSKQIMPMDNIREDVYTRILRKEAGAIFLFVARYMYRNELEIHKECPYPNHREGRHLLPVYDEWNADTRMAVTGEFEAQREEYSDTPDW